jgi:hypothetical protein
LKTARSVIEEQQERLSKMEEKPSPPQQTQQQPGVDLAAQKQLYLSQLQTRAMQSTGITDVADPLLQLEIQRLYAEDRSLMERQATAEVDAETAFSEVSAEFPQFADEDKASVQEALSQVPAVERTPDRIRKEFHAYRGANFEKFAGPGKPSGNGGGKDTPKPGAAAAAVSAAKKGVAPGEGAPQGGTDGQPVKPATDDERKEMKSLNLDSNVPENVAIFRKAKKKKSKYVES